MAAQVADYYDAKRQEGLAKNWAWKYAFQRAKKGKTHEEAAAYADRKASRTEPQETFRPAEQSV